MYPISSLFSDRLKRYDRELVAMVDVAGVEYGRANIVDFSVENALTASEAFEIGTAIQSKLTITLRLKEAVPANARMRPYLALSMAGMTWRDAESTWAETDVIWAGGSTSWLPLGEFFVDSRQKVNDVWTFTCYDKLVFADVPYVSSLSFPASQQAVWNEICSSLGYSYDSSVVINPGYVIQTAPTGYTKRQMLGYIAGANAASVFAGKDGVLRFKRFSASAAPVMELDTGDYIRVRQTNPVKTYTRVVVTYNTDDDLAYEAGSGDDAHTLYLTNPFATQSMTNALYVALNGLSYLPLEMDTRGFPQMDQGDLISYSHYEGATWLEQVTDWADTDLPWNGIRQYATLILRQTFSYKGGLTQKITSPSESDQASEFAIDGSLTSQINNLNKTTVKEGKLYYGAALSREQGLTIERSDGKAKAVFNADELSFYKGSDRALWFDVPSDRYKFTGTLEGVDGVFSGSLSAATGTFAGALQAATGTFSGDLQAAGGTFDGDLIAAGGTFRGNLQAAGGTFSGALLAASGTFSGDLSAAGGTFTGTLVGVDGNFSGTITASTIIGGLITGAKYQTSDTLWPRVVIDPASIAFGVYADPNNGILIPAYDGGVSKIRFLANGNESTIYNSPGLGLAISGFGDLSLSGNTINLFPGSSGYLQIYSWSKFRNQYNGGTLQDALDSKINQAAAASNMTFDSTTRNLKLWSYTGALLAQVNIPS
ncbi:Fibronectin type III protein [compost metagenome]